MCSHDRNLRVSKGPKLFHLRGKPINHSSHWGFVRPGGSLLNVIFPVVLSVHIRTRQLRGMYARFSWEGEPEFLASLYVGVGQNPNRFGGRVMHLCPDWASICANRSSLSASGIGLPGTPQYPNPVADVGGAELGRGETFPFRIVPERVKVL